MRVFLRCLLLLNILLCLPSFCYAQKTICSSVEISAAKYLSANKYNEFIEYLDKLKSKDKAQEICLDFYKAQTRFEQLKYLEEKQSWDEYFSNGNTYRQQLEENAKKVIEQSDAENPLRVKARFILFQFHHGQQDAFVQSALDDLYKDTEAYAEKIVDTKLLKEIADALLNYGEKSKARQIYNLFVKQLVKENITDSELKKSGQDFYKEGNLDLSQAVFNIYIERITKSLSIEKLIPELFNIAELFANKPVTNLDQSKIDMAYAEEIFSKIEALNQKDAFDQEKIYLRAFNLEKLSDYKAAEKFYIQLITLYPQTKYLDEANYKIAMIKAYALADMNESKKYFEKLTVKTEINSHVISAFYQSGLLAQWEGDLPRAKDYYGLLIKNGAEKYNTISSLANERLKEIEEKRQIEYNLKTFLDLSLKNENTLSETGKAELRFSSFVLEKAQKLLVSSFVNMPQSGCNQVQLQYLWSGELGGANPSVMDAGFESSYPDNGTKTINIVVISPAGTIDRSFAMADVY